MVTLRLLWVNERTAGPREAWKDEFASRCRLHEVNVAQLTGSEADGDWDVICFNIDYPEMAQLKLIPQTKHRWPSAPILLLTMQCSTELAVWAMRVRVFDVLIKPITPQEIDTCLQRVTEAVAARRSQSERRPQSLIAPLPMEVRYRPHTTPSQRLQQAVAHVSKHFGQSLPESQMAQLCQMSPSRFCREFKSAYGVTYVEYVARYRVVQAKRLLSNPAMSIADAAAAVGFTDPSYFTRVFRRVTGLSPSAYRGCQPACETDPGEIEFAPSSLTG
jgi:AraC-like DNA-binding protein